MFLQHTLPLLISFSWHVIQEDKLMYLNLFKILIKRWLGYGLYWSYSLFRWFMLCLTERSAILNFRLIPFLHQNACAHIFFSPILHAVTVKDKRVLLSWTSVIAFFPIVIGDHFSRIFFSFFTWLFLQVVSVIN